MHGERTVAAAPADVWELLRDPEQLPRWWPGVKRVEEATPEAWTKVLTSPRGKSVRADYTLEAADPPRRVVWRHEVAESPFERLLAESLTEFELEPAGEGTTVKISVRHSPRGWARLGFLQMRAATQKQVSEALDGLAGALEGRG